MARCSCGNAACSCVVKADPGSGITVVGDGSPARPYRLALVTGGNPLMDAFTVADTPTLDLSLTGKGIPSDRLVLRGNVIAKIRDLADTSKTDTPVVGDVLQWNGVEWVYAPQGATSVAVSGVWGTAPLDKYGADSLIGQPIYLDSAGQIRARPALLNTALYTAASLGSAYPTGYSILALTPTETAVGSGWPITAGYAIVETIRANGTSIVQRLCRTTTTGAQAIFQRSGNDTTWGAWAWVGGQVPHYSAVKTVSQALTVINTSYTLTYDTVVTNEGGITYASGVFTVPVAGKYHVCINQHLQRGTTATFTTYLLKNADIIQVQSFGSVAANFNMTLDKVVKCAAGDTLRFQIRSTVTGCTAYGSTTRYSTMDITLVGG